MEKSNGHLALRAALAMGVPAVLALWAATRPEENSPQRVAGPEDLRLELLHNDMKDVAHYYTHRIFERIRDAVGLK